MLLHCVYAHWKCSYSLPFALKTRRDGVSKINCHELSRHALNVPTHYTLNLIRPSAFVMQMYLHIVAILLSALQVLILTTIALKTRKDAVYIIYYIT